MNARIRIALLLAAVVAIGAAADLGYRWEVGHRPTPPLVGVVHETEIRIAPDTSGRLASLAVSPGQTVRAGETLAKLSTPEVAASLEEAKANAGSAGADLANVEAGVRREKVDAAAQDVAIATANLALAKQEYARVAALASKNFASRQQFDEDSATLAKATAQLDLANAAFAEAKTGPTAEELAIARATFALARASVDAAAAKYAKSTLSAPLDSVARLVVAEPGEAISKGQPVLTLGSADRWFSFTVREDRLNGASVGSTITLRTANGERFEAKVTELRPLGEFAVWRAARAVGDHDLASFLLRADPIGPTPKLEPGMTVWIDEKAKPSST